MASKEQIQEILKTVKYPGFSRDIVSFGLVRSVDIEDENALIGIEITSADESIPEQIAAAIKDSVGQVDGVADVKVRMEITKPERQPGGPQGTDPTQAIASSQSMQKVKFAIAVASGKGGVGKSTVTTNIACALQNLLDAQGRPGVGIMDCDIYGPSISSHARSRRPAGNPK